MSKANNINSESLKIPSTNKFIQLFNKIGNEILELYNSTEKGIIYKRDDSPQTKADRLSHSYLSVFLQANSPYPVLSEEDETSIDTKSDFFWIIDPLDGTKDFIKKTGEFSIMIALIKNYQPIMGLVYQPTTKLLYIAKQNRGAYIFKENSTAHRIKVSKIRKLRDSRMVVSRSHPQEADQKILSMLGMKNAVPYGSFGLKIGLIAQGDAELITYPPKVTSIWDSAPNIIMLSEAGGIMTDLDGNELEVNPFIPCNKRGIVATNGSNHDKVLQAIRKIIKL